MAERFQVTNLNLIGFRVKQRMIERGSIVTQMGTLQVLNGDSLLSKMAFIEPAERGADGSVRYVGPPCTIAHSMQQLQDQLDANGTVLHQLAASYKEEKAHDANT